MYVQARSQEFAMGGGLFWGLGVWGQSPQPPEARGSRDGAPSARKFCIFLQKELHFRATLIKKIMLLKRGLKIGSANMIKLVA